MKDNNKLLEWQRNMEFLAQEYNISPDTTHKPLELFSRLIYSGEFDTAILNELSGMQVSHSLVQFINTTEESLIEIQRLLSLSLNLKIISIDEYNSLSKSLNDISELVSKFIHSFDSGIQTTDGHKVQNEKIIPTPGLN